MSLAILGIHPNEIISLESDNLIIINKGNWDMYWTLANEDLKVEYIEERIYIHTPASVTHERLFRELLLLISSYVKKNTLGEVLGSRFPIQLFDGKRAEPDILFLSNEALKSGELSETIFKGSPSWIIEIISPSYRDHDTETKRKQYKLLNVEEYWIIDFEKKTIEIIKFKNQEEIYQQVISTGVIKPDIKGFTDFGIDIERLWTMKQIE